jgi:hypothetical protein
MRYASPLGERVFNCPPGIATMLQRGAFFANFPLTESGLPVSSAEGAGQERRTQIGTPFQGSTFVLDAIPRALP